MHAIRRILFVVALSIVVSMMPIGLAVSAPAGQTSSTLSRPLPTPPHTTGSAWPYGYPARPGTGARKGQAE